jgi:hypothetical protein
LSYLKYDLTFQGALSVGALFANFWSCWSLLNVYVTMLHTEDVLHRFYYVAHIITSFFMAISIQNPEFTTFNFHYMVTHVEFCCLLFLILTHARLTTHFFPPTKTGMVSRWSFHLMPISNSVHVGICVHQ